MTISLKPYPAYKESGVPWLGNIPVDWEIYRKKNILRERKQKGFPNEPLLAATQTKGVVRKERFESRTVLAIKDLHLLKIVRIGDFVISLRSFQGGIEYAREQGIISPAYTILYPYDISNHGFLAWLFKSKPYIENLSLYVTGIRQGQNIDYEKLSRSFIPLPPKNEQSAIVRFLDHADQLIRRYINAKKRLIELLNEQKQAIINHAVTRGLVPNAPLKPSGIPWLGDIPNNFPIHRLKYIAQIIDGDRGSEYPGPSDLQDDGIPFLSSRNIIFGKIDFNGAHFISEEKFRKLRQGKLRKGDLIITVRGTIGSIALFTGMDYENSFINAQMMILRPKKNILSEYLYQVASSSFWFNEIEYYSYGSAQQQLSNYILGNIKVPLPTIPIQKQILDQIFHKCKNIDMALNHAIMEINFIREYRTRLISDVVTGKIDVRNIPISEIEDIEELPESDIIDETEESNSIKNMPEEDE